MVGAASVEQLREQYLKIKGEIERRIAEFVRKGREAHEEELFAELAFCLLTPQSKARVCWSAIERLRQEGLLLEGKPEEVESLLRGVRFKRNKARYIVEARKVYGKLRELLESFDSAVKARLWFVKNIKGMGLKEGSHFLRNVGMGLELAILDRHILKNLAMFRVIERVPSSLTPALYFEIERRMRDFSRSVDIPLPHLDLLFWYRQTGEVFK